MEKVGKFELLFLSAFSDEFSNHVYFNENLRKYPPPQTVQRLGIPFLLKMQHEVLLFFFSPHFIDDTFNTKAECVKDSLICRKYVSGQNICMKVYGNSVGTFTLKVGNVHIFVLFRPLLEF